MIRVSEAEFWYYLITILFILFQVIPQLGLTLAPVAAVYLATLQAPAPQVEDCLATQQLVKISRLEGASVSTWEELQASIPQVCVRTVSVYAAFGE